ncbi:MAG: caspase domain-containing protein [Bacteroidota bacterium]
MRPFVSPLLFLIFSYSLFGQVVDKTRLEYDEEQLTALQIGMSVTSDRKYAAFLLDNGELKILDFFNSMFPYSYRLDLNEVLEIAFTQDDQALLIVENNRIRVLDWKTGEILLTKDYQETPICARIARFDNFFGIAFENRVEIWDKDALEITRTLKIKQNIKIIDFSYTKPEVLISPTWSIIKNQMYSFNYKTGQEVENYKKKYLGLYDKSGKTYYYQNNAIPGLPPAMPVYGHRTLPNGPDYQPLVVFDGKQEKNSDVGGLMTNLRINEKVIGSLGYRGFSVYDFNKGGRVFTTKKTKRERSSGGLTYMGDYQAYPHYQIDDDKALINAYGDNINQIYSASQNAIIGYLFIDGNGEFAVVSRDGRFDGSYASSEKLYYSARNSNKKTSLASLFERGFTPKLLRSILGEQEIAEEIDLEEEIESLPVIKITSFDGKPVTTSDGLIKVSASKKLVQLQVETAENEQNLSQLKLYHNNKLVAVNENPVGKVSFDLTLSNALGNENYVYVVGTATSGIDTEKQKMIITYSGTSDAPPKMYLVTVGINEYKNPRYNLNYAIADADAFSETLNGGQSALFSEVKHIPIRNSKFTKDEMNNVFSSIMSEAQEQDLFVFYYAGHGVMSKGIDAPAEFFLVPHDITQIYGRDDLLFEKALSASELKEISKNINAQKQLFILDACQSAAALDAIASRGILEEKAIAQLARSTGTFWITATGSEQFATEFETIGHGVFTYSLLEALQGKADGANGDQKITVREISAYLEERVPELAEKYLGTPQYPSSYSFGNDFPILIYKGN